MSDAALGGFAGGEGFAVLRSGQGDENRRKSEGEENEAQFAGMESGFVAERAKDGEGGVSQ